MIDDTEKTYIIAVPREEAYSFDIEAESPEEAVKLVEAQMRKATAHSVPGGTLCAREVGFSFRKAVGCEGSR